MHMFNFVTVEGKSVVSFVEHIFVIEVNYTDRNFLLTLVSGSVLRNYTIDSHWNDSIIKLLVDINPAEPGSGG